MRDRFAVALGKRVIARVCRWLFPFAAFTFATLSVILIALAALSHEFTLPSAMSLSFWTTVAIVGCGSPFVFFATAEDSYYSCIDWWHTPRGLCTSCSYDVRGLSGTDCPECGRAIDPRVKEAHAKPNPRSTSPTPHHPQPISATPWNTCALLAQRVLTRVVLFGGTTYAFCGVCSMLVLIPFAAIDRTVSIWQAIDASSFTTAAFTIGTLPLAVLGALIHSWVTRDGWMPARADSPQSH